MAHHFTEAGLFEKAVEYWRRAGRRSVARSGFVEAITQLRMGLRLIPNLPDTRERKQQELELQIALGGALTVIKGYAHPEVEEAFGRAHSLISETGRVGTVVHFSMLRGLWAAEFVGGKPRAALDRADEFLLLAQSQQDSRVLTTGHWLAGRVLIAIGDFPAATSHLERAVGLYRAEKNWIFDPRLGADPGVTALATWDCHSGTRATLSRHARRSTRHSSAPGNSVTSIPSHMHFSSPVWRRSPQGTRSKQKS